MVAIYEDKPAFFDEVMNEVKRLDCTYSVIGGDYNVALDSKLDRNDDRMYNPNAVKKLNEWLSEGYSDVWRIQNLESKRFTWIKTNPKITWSRIDYFLISDNLINTTLRTDIIPCVHSDHSAITMEIDLCTGERGPGIWKFNDTFLNDESFNEKMSNLIRGVCRTYDYLPPVELWELLKSEIIKYSREYGKRKSLNEKCERFNLYKILSAIQEQIVTSKDVSNQMVHNMVKVQLEIDSYETLDAKRSAFRCKQNWAKNGELPSKFFFNMEKRNFTKKAMYVARRQGGPLRKTTKKS